MKAIYFKSLTENDLPLLFTWFQKPHIKKWYARGEEYTFDMIKKKYLSRIIDSESIPNFIIFADDTPIGYIQFYCVKDYFPDGVTDYSHPLFDSYKPSEIAGVDLFIAEENYLKNGYATLALTEFIKNYIRKRFALLIADPLKSNKNAVQFFMKNKFELFRRNKDDSANELMFLQMTPMDGTPKIILITDRLILRTWKHSDISLMAAISSDPVVMKHFPAIQDIPATEAFVNHINQHYEKYGYALYAVELKESHEFIGFVGLNHPLFKIPTFQPKGLPFVEMSWRLSSQHWGKGYATEAARAVLHYAFTELKLNEIISFTVEDNTKSRRVMEKIGLQHSINDDFDHPKLEESSPLKRHVLYRMTRDNYRANHR